MFSQSPAVNQVAPSGAGSVRSSRRRQRPLSNEGSIIQPKAKRQRSALSEQTFLPLDDAVEMEEVKKIAALPKRQPSLPNPRREIAVRSKKTRTGDRIEKGDGSTILTKNDTYTVSKLPALPDRLRGDSTGRQHGAIYSDSGYALTFTHTHALVWQYTSSKYSPDTFIFKLPYPSKHGNDPLPLGALVSASSSTDEPGLVVVMPAGTITYWESIASAATLDLIKQQRNGVELTIPGMYKGEVVSQVLNAESAGFILAFDSGRTAYMNVRDGQGRPAISVQFMRSTGLAKGGGIFGSIRNYVKSGIVEEIAAVRAGPPDKVGERDVVVATTTGKISFWKVHRGGHNALYAEAEGREAIVMALKERQLSLSDLSLETFELIDFTYTPKPLAGTQGDRLEGEHLLLLVSLGRGSIVHYALINVVLQPESPVIITDIRPIKSYTTPINRQALSKPRLHLPNPALIAYIVFDRAVVIYSMAKRPESPDSQLRAESHLLETYEDVVDFRGDINVEIVGSGTEEPHGPNSEDSRSRRSRVKNPATVLLVRGGGVVRIASTDIAKHLAAGIAPKVTARSKLEQAVVFGTLEHNPINFTVRPELQFPPEEIAEAALSLSLDILKAIVKPHTSNAPASIGTNLQKRAAALQYLAEFLKASGVKLDRVTRWKLLWDAEKIEAASIIWKSYDASLAAKPEGQKRSLITELVESIHEDYKSEPVSEEGELDRVRHWFIHDIYNLEIAIPWAFQVIKYTYQDGQTEHNHIMNILSEADDLVIGALEGAFSFRAKNLGLYGLQAERLEYGVLQSNFEDLPEFWTSTQFIVANLRKQATLAGALLQEYWPKTIGDGHEDKYRIDPTLMEKVRIENPKLVDLAIRSNSERIFWLSAQGSPGQQIEANSIQEEQAKVQHEQILLLAEGLDLADEALALGEKHQLVQSLAVVIKQELNECSLRLRGGSLDAEEFRFWGERTAILDDYVRRYFEKFGAKWAAAFYGHQIELGAMSDLLDTYQEPGQLPFLTAFLRSSPEYSKIAWIHEINREHNFDRASKTLFELAEQREQHLWSKKVELSLCKLARMAACQVDAVAFPVGEQTDLGVIKKDLGLANIQQQVYAYILPSIEAAIDENAEVQLAIEAHGNRKGLKKRKALASLLEQALSKLVKQESLGVMTLIDVLTLMDSAEKSAEGTFKGQQFYLALKALRFGISSREEQDLLLRIIWRRCILKDDWKAVNNTESKDDEHVQNQLRLTALYMTFKACFKDRIFENNSPVKHINPQQILGSCSDELDHRFKGMDASQRETLVKDMQAEDDALVPFIEHSQLDRWYQAAMDLAKQDFTDEVNQETNEGDSMKLVALQLAEIEKDLRAKSREEAEELLHSYEPKKGLEVKKFTRSSRRANNKADHY